MKRRITITVLSLTLLLGLAPWSAGRGVKAKTTPAAAAVAIKAPMLAAINVPAGGPSATAQAQNGCATASFAAAANFGAGDGPFSITTGDFNSDGKLDLAAANSFSDNVSILLGNGAGGFAAATNFGAGGFPTSVTTSDFNADGKLDLATANQGSDNVSILLGNGMGGFAAATNFGAGDAPFSVTTGDFNSDGKLDLATANHGSDNVSILLGNGTGGFAAATNFGAGDAPRSVTTGDFNADGKLDLATANQNTDNVSVLLGNGMGGFAAATNFGAGDAPFSVTTGDFNSDGKLDLATANLVSANVSILLGNGTGGFSAATNFGVGDSPRSITTGDFNSDGKLDLAAANGFSDNVSILLGNGAGGFAAATNFGAGDGPSSVTAGDFNADGKLDLATANQLSDNVSVLLNTCDAFPCGATSFAAAANFGAGDGPFSVTTGDFNADGKLDLATTNQNSDNVSILLGNGMGGFSAATNFGAGVDPFSVTTGDFNADGKLDLATANAFSDNVSILLGDGLGGFSAATNFGAGDNPRSVTTGDFNTDGKLDLATANQFSNNVSILLGDGLGGFASPANFGAGNGPVSVTAGDFNGDGKLDLATANLSNNVSVLLGNGLGGFASPANFGAGVIPPSVTTGDFNADGKLDLATANLLSDNVSVLLGNGMGGFSAATNFGVGDAPFSVTAGDFNADGKLDLATANRNSNNVSVLLGNGMGGFAAATNFGAGNAPFSVTTGDFNADGKLDLATANLNSDNVSVLLNDCTANTAPTISAIGVTRTAGGPSANSQIATVSDAQQAPDTLSVTATPLGGSGVTLSNTSVSPAGAVTADVAASCAATTSTFRLRVTDSGSLFAEATLTVTVTAETTPPVINAPPNVSISTGPGATGCGVVISDATLGTATATDNCSGSLPVTRMNVPPGNLFPVGTTTLIHTATDAAGNSQTATQIVTVSDNTPPAIAAGAKKADNTPYIAGTWTNQTVTVHFTCSDNCSLASCPADVVLAGTGVTALVSGTATDGAGNTASTGFGPIWIDKMAPAVSVAGVANGATYPLGNVPAAACNTTDAHSGVAVAAALSLTGGNAQGVGTFTAACGSATDNVGNASAPVSVSYTVAYNLNKFVALAQEGVELDQRSSVVSGDVGARIHSNGPFLGDGVEVSIGQQVEMLSPASRLLGDSISIKQRATVYNPSYNDLDNNGTVLGTAATPLNLSLIPMLPALPTITPGTRNFEVAQQGTLTINAGSYGDLNVRQRATITFTGGVYHFRSWDVGQQVNLYFLAPTEIRIAGKLGVDQRSYVGPAPSATSLTARDIVLYVAGQNGNSGTLGANPEAAAFGQETTLKANVVAPNGTLLLRQRTEATGAFFGKWFQAGQQVKLTLESRFGL